MVKKYVYSKFDGFDLGLFRIGGPGLSNLLFAWGKTIVDSKNENLILISSTFFDIKGLLKKRSYFQIKKEENSIYGLKKLFLIIFKKKIIKYNYIGTVGDFSSFKNEKFFLHENLVKLLNKKYQNKLNEYFPEICIHIRLGDFKINNGDLVGRNQRIDLSWYLGLIKKINQITDFKYSIHIFSDGNNEELKELLSITNVELISSNFALFDLLRLSKGKIIITSLSSFSMWACFLQKKTGHSIWYKNSQLNFDLKYIKNQNFIGNKIKASELINILN